MLESIPATIPVRPIRVLCVDDSRDVTASLRMLFESEGMACVGCLGSADALLDEVRRLKPDQGLSGDAADAGVDIVLLDASMPGKDPFQAMSELAAAFPQVRTIIFSAHEGQAFMDRAVRGGGWGCISKLADPPEIFRAVREVAAGSRSFPAVRSHR